MNWKKVVVTVGLVFLAVVITVVSLTLYVVFKYPGGNMSITPLNFFMLEEGVSTTWCQAMWISSADTTMNASVFPSAPQSSPNIHTKYFQNLSATLKSDEKISWTYFLTANSSLDVKQCSTAVDVLSFIFRGEKVDDRCVKLEKLKLFLERDYNDFESLSRSFRFSEKPDCNQITLKRELVKVCRGAMQDVSVTVSKSDYYQVFYWNQNSNQDAEVRVQLMMDRFDYDKSGSLSNCTLQSYCTMPLRFSSSDTVLGILSPSQSFQSHQIKWGCVPRQALYLIVFLGTPICSIIFVVIIYLICTKKLIRSRKTPTTQTEEEAEDEKRSLLDENEAERNPDYYAITPESSSSILHHTGPIPGPYSPSAPLVDDSRNPPLYPREPPPAYEESERQSKKKQLVEA